MLVDDHPVIRETLRKVINYENDIEVIAEAESGAAALDLLQQIHPDVILMDGSMPAMNGIETTRRVKQLDPKAKVIGLTLYSESTYLEEMVAVGASGYLMKTGAPQNVLNGIRIVNEGGTYFDPAVPRGQPTPAATLRPANEQLTEKLTADELAVARLIANGQANSEIAPSLGVKLKTVEARRNAAMKKLGLRSRAELVRVAAKRNWLTS